LRRLVGNTGDLAAIYIKKGDRQVPGIWQIEFEGDPVPKGLWVEAF
jgi:hypothetical protein